jgi:DNA polymerase-3 subunit delta
MTADKSLPQNLLIWAGDSRFLEEPSAAWASQWGGADGAVNLAAAGLDPGAFSMEINSIPMWSARQVVRLRQAEAAAEDLVQALSRYLQNPAPSTALLVEYTGDLSPKSKTAPARWKAILAQIEAISCEPKSAREYISRRLRTEGFSIEPEAAVSLEEWACGEVGRIVSALDLLCLFKLEQKRITSEDLDALLGTGGTPREWDLQDAFLRGDRRTFLDLLKKIAEDPDSVPLLFVGMLAKQLRSLLLMHGFESRGVSRKEIPPKELGFNHPFPAQKLIAVSGKWPESRVRQTLGALFELDLDLKSTLGQSDKRQPEKVWALVEQRLLKLMPN